MYNHMYWFKEMICENSKDSKGFDIVKKRGKLGLRALNMKSVIKAHV